MPHIYADIEILVTKIKEPKKSKDMITEYKPKKLTGEVKGTLLRFVVEGDCKVEVIVNDHIVEEIE